MPSLIQTQQRFSAYIRDPESNPAPDDVAPRRMAMYRELFYNNVESFLSGNFPVLRSLYGDGAWHALAQDFFARHRCRTPYFYAIPEEFLAFLRDERDRQHDDPPFLQELAHYEWAEMAVAIAQGEPPPPLAGDVIG
ncbi:DNA-binding domain-containing protein, partial [Methylogaea oryzae]